MLASMRPWVGVCVCVYACVRSVGVFACLQKSLCVVAVRTKRAVCLTSLHNFNSHEEIGDWHAFC